MSFVQYIFIFSAVSSFLSAIFIGVILLETPSNKALRSFFLCFSLLATGYMLYLAKGVLPEVIPNFIGGMFVFCGVIFYSIGLNYLVEKNRAWYWYIILLFIYIILTFYYSQIDSHRGARILSRSVLCLVLMNYMFYDICMYYKTSRRSVKILVLSIIAQIELVLLVLTIKAIADYSIIAITMQQSPGLTFIRSIIPLCYIEMGFMCLLLFSDAATNKEKETGDKLMTVIEERDQLYATVAHELNSPLNSTLHMIDLLKLSDPKKDQPDVFDTVSNILGDLRLTLTELLNWAQRCQSCDLNMGVVSDVEFRRIIADYLDSLNTKQMKLDLSLPKETKGQLDKDLLFIVMRVFMSNAIRHGKHDSLIKVKVNEALSQCIISIENEIDTTKSHDTGQRLGLKLLKDLIEKGQGVLSVLQDKNNFTASVTLPVR